MDVEHVLSLHHSRASADRDTGAGHRCRTCRRRPRADRESSEVGTKTVKLWKSAGFCMFLTSPADPRSDGATEVMLNTVATLQRQVTWVKYGRISIRSIPDLQTLPLVLSHQDGKANSEVAELKGYIT